MYKLLTFDKLPGMKRRSFLLTLILGIFFLGCHKNETPDTVPEPPVNDIEKVTASVTGIVVNENNVPISGALVSCGSETANTNTQGMFRFNNISISKNNGSVKVVKTGYFNGNRSFVTTAGRNHNLRIKLIPKTNSGNFSATAGGTVSITGGGKVTIPAAAITDASGNAYSGTVNVAMTWLNPVSPDLNNIIVGDLRGVTAGGQERVLETYGMLGVELSGSSGQVLKIANGKTAELTFPIPTALQASSPASIKLWYFDEITGRWKEEGSATKTGNNYVGTVTHFSFWNCDVPFPLVDLCMTLVNPGNQPLNNVAVRITRVSVPTSVATGYTDSLGNLCGKVPKDEPLKLEVLGLCGTVVYSQNIGPFSSNTSLGNITVTIPTSNLVTVTGNVVNCANAPVTNGYVYLYTSQGYYYNVPLSANGSFAATLLNCGGVVTSFSAVGIDNTAQQQGSPVTGSAASGTVNLGTVSACGTSSAEFVTVIINGVTYNFNRPADSVNTLAGLTFFTHPFATVVYAHRNNLLDYINFNFPFDATPGVYPIMPTSMVGLRLNSGLIASDTVVTVSPTLTLTEAGQLFTGFLAGSFTIDMKFNTPPLIRTVNCTFRARRTR
jgi:hypothetical protein